MDERASHIEQEVIESPSNPPRLEWVTPALEQFELKGALGGVANANPVDFVSTSS